MAGWVRSRYRLPDKDQDGTWKALAAAAANLSARYSEASGLSVLPVRRQQGRTQTDGLFAGDGWTDVFEPIRHRSKGNYAWTT